jgi:hypothetical protein
MADASSPFDPVWERIVRNSGEFFQTQAGGWFTYRIEGGELLPSHSDARIARANFETAFPLLPLPSPAKIGKFVSGSKWVWAILHDPRVSQGEW